MAKGAKKTETAKEEKQVVDMKEIKYLKKIYEDFKVTMAEVLGDSKDFVFKHKTLLVIAFILFLLFWNKRFTIKQFADELVERLKEDRDW